MRIKIFFAVIFLLLSNAYAVIPVNDFALIPIPVKLVAKEGEFVINSKTTYYIDNQEENGVLLVNQLHQLFAGLSISEPSFSENKKNSIVFLKDSAIQHDEGYNIVVSSKQIEVKYKTLQGAFYAVQTLKQLTPLDGQRKAIVPACKIEDYPQLDYRGYMLDVSRHFFPIEYLKKTIDALAFYKINVFHLHLTDDQGWRVEIKKYPRLTEIGAWRPETQNGHRTDIPLTFDGIKHGGYYTQEELKDLVQYAGKRFIRIIPEIDIPGHSQALLAAYPEFGCVEDTTYTVSSVWGIHDNILCPKEQTFSFLEDIFNEVITIFPDKYIHIGGDEVVKKRWKESAFCQQLIKEKKLVDEEGLQKYFISRIEKFLKTKGKAIIGWDEILEGSPSDSMTTIMSWRGEKGGIKGAQGGYNVIMTPNQYMYFNYYNTKFKAAKEPLANTAVLSLKKVYNYNPFPDQLNGLEKKRIIGLQASLWTEYCKTEQQADALTFPRLCAMAEVAWTPSDMRKYNYNSFYQRLLVNIKHLDLMGMNYSKLFLKYDE